MWKRPDEMFLEGHWEEGGFPRWMSPLLAPDPSGLGTVTMEPEVVSVLDSAELTLRFRVGPRGLPEGTRINYVFIGCRVLAPFQDSEPGDANYVSSHVNGAARPKLSLWWEPILQAICLKLNGGALKEGDTVDVLIGDKSAGGPGLALRQFSFASPFQVWIKLPDWEEYTTLPRRPLLTVRARSATAFKVLTPSVARSTSEVVAQISAIDDSKNVDFGFTGSVVIRGHGIEQVQHILPQDRGQIKTKLPSRMLDGDRARITVTSVDGSLAGVNNPTLVEHKPGDEQIYWGDLHGHTALSTLAAFHPDDYFRYAREESHLDFASLTDSDHFMSPERWEITRDTTARHHEHGEFVTFLGFEWSSGSMRTPGKPYYGHKTVVFPTDLGRCLPYTDEAYETPNKLWAHLKGTGALTIPHHTAYPFDWKDVSGADWRYHDPSMQRLVEIYSRHGCSECVGCARPVLDKQKNPATWEPGTVQYALSLGYRLGFIASSDTQIGRPGHPFHEPKPTSNYRCGLTAVFANGRTREAIWEGLWNRHCYGTTGQRIVLQFWINGHMMGEEFESPADAVRNISVRVLGTDQIERVVVLKNNQPFHVQRGASDSVQFSCVDDAPLNGMAFYYVRVVQADGELAWASPIWVTPAGSFPPLLPQWRESSAQNR